MHYAIRAAATIVIALAMSPAHAQLSPGETSPETPAQRTFYFQGQQRDIGAPDAPEADASAPAAPADAATGEGAEEMHSAPSAEPDAPSMDEIIEPAEEERREEVRSNRMFPSFGLIGSAAGAIIGGGVLAILVLKRKPRVRGVPAAAAAVNEKTAG